VTTPKGSYDLKLDRAEKHLLDLKAAIGRYTREHPYEVRRTIEGKQKRVVHRFHFTKQPDPEVGLIAADFIYNVRSALDHLMAALVPSARRSKVYFPIYWQGVWEPKVEGEHSERTKDRGRWESDTRKAKPEAIAILQANQPDVDAWDNSGKHTALIILNKIAVKDRHQKLPIIASTLRDAVGECLEADGTWRRIRATGIGPNDGPRDGAELFLPEGAMDVKIQGTPEVMIRVKADDQGGFRIPSAFEGSLLPGTRRMVELLRPYTRL
jgi:hypothetical protein